MLFKRKHKQSIFLRIRNFIWPTMGWVRTYHYIKHRILRLPASNHSVALGLTIGCVISWTPSIPFQIAQCFIICLMFRANFLAAVIGTGIGNPWTFMFLFWTSYQVGSFIFSMLGFGDLLTVEVSIINILKNLVGHPQAVLWPSLLGGYVLALVTAPLFYFPFYYLVKGGRAARVKVSAKVHNIIDHRKESKNK